MNDTLKVEAPKAAWEVLIQMLNIAVQAKGLEVAENAVYWAKTIQAAAQAGDAPPKADKIDITPNANPNAPKMTVVHDSAKDSGAESPE